jgi:hypothetical protein
MEVGNLIVLSKISLNTASALNGRSRTLVNWNLRKGNRSPYMLCCWYQEKRKK